MCMHTTVGDTSFELWLMPDSRAVHRKEKGGGAEQPPVCGLPDKMMEGGEENSDPKERLMTSSGNNLHTHRHSLNDTVC